MPGTSPLAGGIELTISGENLATGADISRVTLAGVQATILTQTSTQVVVRTAARATNVVGDIVVVSTSFGTMRLDDSFTYSGMTLLFSATYSVADCLAMQMVRSLRFDRQAAPRAVVAVTITGRNLGSGTDIVTVTFGMVRGNIISQTTTQVCVSVSICVRELLNNLFVCASVIVIVAGRSYCASRYGPARVTVFHQPGHHFDGGRLHIHARHERLDLPARSVSLHSSQRRSSEPAGTQHRRQPAGTLSHREKLLHCA